MDNNRGSRKPLWGQRIIILFVLGAVIFAGYYYFTSGKKNASVPVVSQSTPAAQYSPAPASSEKNSIILNSNGFSPSPFTIKTGDSVYWVNQSGKTATIDSDTHPTHMAYAPLNLGSFDNGATLSLTFDKAGSYGYHNHYNPSVRGTIIVE